MGLLSLTQAAPTVTSTTTSAGRGIVDTIDTVAGVATIPLVSPLWFNGLASQINQGLYANEKTTPAGYTPAAIKADETNWVVNSTVNMSIMYVRNNATNENAEDSETKVSLWSAKPHFPDSKVSAMYLNVTGAIAPLDADKFVRHFECHTGPRLYPSTHAYLKISVSEPELSIESDRFVTEDDHTFSVISGSSYGIACQYASDEPNADITVYESHGDDSKIEVTDNQAPDAKDVASQVGINA